jgi:hypothetical protein
MFWEQKHSIYVQTTFKEKRRLGENRPTAWIRVFGEQEELESKGFGRWCKTFRITGFLDFVHRPGFQITREYNVLETGSVPVLT